jgi:hypothetical protein
LRTERPVDAGILDHDERALRSEAASFRCGKEESCLRSVAARTSFALAPIIDRFRTVGELEKISETRPQVFELLPNNRLHHFGENDLAIVARDVGGKYIFVFDIDANGRVQSLLPKARTSAASAADEWRLRPIRVTEPFGADTVVAITADQPLDGLSNALKRLGDRPAAGPLLDLVAQLPKAASPRLGLVTIFTRHEGLRGTRSCPAARRAWSE